MGGTPKAGGPVARGCLGSRACTLTLVSAQVTRRARTTPEYNGPARGHRAVRPEGASDGRGRSICDNGTDDEPARTTLPGAPRSPEHRPRAAEPGQGATHPDHPSRRPADRPA